MIRISDTRRRARNNKSVTKMSRISDVQRRAKILNMKYVVLTTSGTSALFLASLASGINKNKKVYLSNLNWVATSNPPKFLGSKISMIDSFEL